MPLGCGATVLCIDGWVWCCRESHSCPFDPHQVLDAFRRNGVEGHPSVEAIIAESKQLQEWQDLFELYVQVQGEWGDGMRGLREALSGDQRSACIMLGARCRAL